MESNPLAIWLIAFYLICLPVIGWLAKSKNTRLKDYYLAGGSVGFVGLFFTLYASTYSGNTMLGFAGRAYREGPVSLFTVIGMASVIPVFMLFARRLNRLAKEHNFVTIADFLKLRYRNLGLVYLINTLLILTLASYVLTNLKAAGLLVEVISDGKISMVHAIFGLAIVMAVYESLGGMRAVIWTDMLQGIMLLVGSIVVFSIVAVEVTAKAEFIEQLKVGSRTWVPLDDNQIRRGISLIMMFGVAIAIYPHALQRIFAAKNWETLRSSFKWMCLMPLLTTLPIMLSGLLAVFVLGQSQPLQGGDTDRVIPILLQYLSTEVPMLKWVVALFMAAALAAIMSTVDSALLSLGSMFTQDIIRPVYTSLDDKRLAFIGRVMTWLLMLVTAVLAAFVSKTIWSLIVLKLEIMLQLAPSIILGVLISRLNWLNVFCGIVVGVSVTIALKFIPSGESYMFGIHAGIWGLGANLMVIFLTQVLVPHKNKDVLLH